MEKHSQKRACGGSAFAGAKIIQKANPLARSKDKTASNTTSQRGASFGIVSSVPDGLAAGCEASGGLGDDAGSRIGSGISWASEGDFVQIDYQYGNLLGG